MIETFDPGAVNPHSSRKHRRLDDSLSDGGDTRPVGPSLPPSYKESLMKDSESTFCDADAFFDDEDVEILEVLLPAPVSAEPVMEQAPANHPKVSHHTPTVITNQDDGAVGSFGPWMGSRFNPIHASDMDEEPAGNNVVPPKTSVPSSLHQSRKTTAPSHLKVAAKKKMILAGKMSKATPLRKPMTVNLLDFPILSKFSATASSSKSATTQGTLLDKTRHSVTTMNENADPNIVHSGSATNLAQDKSLILGDPPDVITGSDGPFGPSIMLKSASGDTLTKPARSNQHMDEGRVGCGDARFLPAAKQFLRDNKPDVVVFVEPRIRGRRADSVISSLGFPNSHRVEANGFAGGIWVAWQLPSRSARAYALS
ncbi:hypothetical protein V6N13_047796 [Hibiscus sabdariffa]